MYILLQRRMAASQAAVSGGLLPPKLDASDPGSSLDASNCAGLPVGSQSWRGLRKCTPGQRLMYSPKQRAKQQQAMAGDANGSSREWGGLDGPPSVSAGAGKSDDSINFCIIEGRDTVSDFAQLQLQEIRDNINSRRNKIFLLMEEVRRLRIQQRIKADEAGQGNMPSDLSLDDASEEMKYDSSIPFLPPLTSATLQQYYATCFALVSGVILFGGLLAPVLELKLGLGGTSYAEFIKSMHLPYQLSQVDPIVASFSGGAVGVISALMVVEVNNVRQQERKRCHYCHGTGYLACARCSGSGQSSFSESSQLHDERVAESLRPSASPVTRCSNCAGAGKVMCPTCLCTGVALATEHDPRIDPFV